VSATQEANLNEFPGHMSDPATPQLPSRLRGHVANAVGHIPLMIGTTTDESVVFAPSLSDPNLTEHGLLDQLRTFFLGPVLADDDWLRLLEAYRAALPPSTNNSDIGVALTTDLSFWGSTREVIERRAKHAVAATFVYEFDWPTPCYGSQWSPHAGEVPFIFGNLHYPSAWDGTDSDEARSAADPEGDRFQLSDAMLAAWTVFAHQGDPSASLPTWTSWSRADRSTMVFSKTGPHLERDRHEVRWSLVRDLPRGW
jgi:para-nitrobenzyl esterase